MSNQRIRPVESHSGARETIIAGAYHNLIPHGPRWRRISTFSRQGENVGRGGPSPSDERSRGASQALPAGWPKWIWGQKEAIWNTLFSIFERWRGPLKVAGSGKTSPFPPPSRRACNKLRRTVRPNNTVIRCFILVHFCLYCSFWLLISFAIYV